MSLDNPYRTPQELEPPTASTNLGLVPHIRAVAALMVLHGLLLCAFGAMMAFSLVISLSPQFRGAFNPQQLQILSWIYAVGAAAGLVPGILNVVAGCLNFFVRGRKLGLIALFAGLLAMGTFYCLPTAVGLCIYGAVVYFNPSVAAAFRMGDLGYSWDEILTAAHAGALTKPAGKPPAASP